jgi:hypothetical protein
MTSEKIDRNGKQPAICAIPDCPAVPVVDGDVSKDFHSTDTYVVPLLDPDQERRLMVFTDFWYIAVRYQIANDLTDHRLVLEYLGLSDKTFGNWRNCIISSGVVEDLVAIIDKFSGKTLSENRAVVRAGLVRRLNELEAIPHATRNKWGTLPSVRAFKYAVEYSIETVMMSFIMDLRTRGAGETDWKKPTADEKDLANELAAELIELFQPSTETKLEAYRNEFERRLVKVSECSLRLSLRRGTAARFFGDDDSCFVKELAVAIDEAQQDARAYINQLYSRVLSGDQFSERASFRARLSSGQSLYQSGPITDLSDLLHPERIKEAKQAEVDQLYRLIQLYAEVRVP